MTGTGQRTRRRQLREETREQVLDAARELLRERRYRDLSVDAIMSRTGHTRTVFYRHFDGIPTLMLTLIEEIGGEIAGLAQAWSGSDRVGPDEARARLAGIVDFYGRHGRIVRAAIEATHHDDRVEAAWTTLQAGFIATTTEAIERRIASGDLRPLDAPQIARALMRMIGGYLGDTLGRGPDAPGAVEPERVLETLTTIWTRTLFPPPDAGAILTH